jgi:MoxR-like ATPases
MTMITNSSSVPMEERQVTLDGKTYELKPMFHVFATQNPIEHEGTYRLPEAQMDRFLFKILVGYPEAEHEERGSSRVDLQACKLGTGRRFTTS